MNRSKPSPPSGAPSKWRRRILMTLGIALGLLLATLIVVKLRYGGGKPYPSVATPPLVPRSDVKVLVEMQYPPGNVTASKSGRIFYNIHPFVQAHRFTSEYLFELVDGKSRPFPDGATQGDLKFVFGMHADQQDRLWTTSPATLDRDVTRIQAFDLATGKRIVDRELPKGVGRFAQDLRVTHDGQYLILADTGAFQFTDPAIVVVDLRDFSAREVLKGHATTRPQDWLIMTAKGPYRIGFGLLTFSVGVDGIAFSRDGAWLHFGTMSHDSLYRVRTSDLVDARLSPEALASRVERVGPKPLSDGIEVAPDGSVFITDVEHGGIARLDARGELRTLTRDDAVVWADGITFLPSGEAVFTDSSIPSYIDPMLRPPDPARLKASAPYHIYAFKAP